MIARRLRSVFLVAALGASALAHAQAYPNKPIRLLVGFGPGGVTDIINRVVADEMGKRLGQPVVVENRPGANGLVAAHAARTAQPDGYTLVGGSVTILSPVFTKENAIVASKELQPVATMALGDWFLYAPTSAGINNLKDLVAWSKANPGKLRAATPSASNHMVLAVMGKRMGFQFENIPYKTTDQTIAAMLQGDAQFTINAASGFGPHLQSGKLKAIATLAPQRLANMPDVPTATEQGLPLVLRFNQGLWTALGTPRDIVMKLNGVVNESLKQPSVAEKVANAALVIVPMTPDEMIKAYDTEMPFYTEAAALIGFKPQ